MAPTDTKKKTALYLLAWLCGLGVVWFSAPLILRSSMKSEAFVSHVFVPVKLAPETVRQLHNDIVKKNKELAAAKRKGGAHVSDIQLALGIDAEELGAFGKAHAYYQAVVARDTTNASVWAHLGSLYESMELYDRAILAWRECIERDPGNTIPYERLASLHEGHFKDIEKANGLYVEGLVRAGNPAGLMRSYAQFLDRVGEKHTATLYWKALVDKDPKDADAQQHLKRL